MLDESAVQVRLLLTRSFGAAASLGALLCAAPAFAASCEDLANLKLPDTTIESAQIVPAGD